MPQEWDEKGKLVDRAVSEWDEKGNPVPKGGQAAPAASASTPGKRGLLQRVNDWWKAPSEDIAPSNVPGVEQPLGTESSPRQTFQRGLGISSAVAAPAAVSGLLAAPVATTLGLAGGVAGGYGGGRAGKWAGEKVGAPELGEDIGSVAGGAVGGTVGGGTGGALARRVGASKSLVSVPNRTIGDVLESPSKVPGYALRKFFPKPTEAAAPTAAPSVVGTSTAAPVGNAKLPPVPATPQAPMDLGARTAARAATPAPSGVTRVPVPREPMPGDPNLMGSVPRPELPEMSGRGVPGAADQERLLGKPIVYTPPEGYPPPRSVTNLSERVPQPEQPNLTQRTVAPMEPESDMEMELRRGNAGPAETLSESIARQQQEAATAAESQRQAWEQQQRQSSKLLNQRAARNRATVIRRRQ